MSSLACKMPGTTSKIPLPKSALASPVHGGTGDSVVPSPQSRIPVMRGMVGGTPGLKSPGVEYSSNTFSTPQNKENIMDTSYQNTPAPKKSRIPDIRTKVSPSKEVLDHDAGYKSDRSTKSTNSSLSKVPSSSHSKIPTSPTRIPGGTHLPCSVGSLPPSSVGSLPPSRIPTLPSPVKGTASGKSSISSSKSHHKSSVESLSTEELDWDISKDYQHLIPRRDSEGGTCFPPQSRGRSSSGTRSSPSPSSVPGTRSSPSPSSTTTSSTSSSPHKRGREPEIASGSKMRRTSPDGESVSPSKTRRPSPSKIPIAGSYVNKNSNSSSNSTEDFLSPRQTSWVGEKLSANASLSEVIAPSQSVHSELFQTAQESEEEEDHFLGGGEGLCPLEGGEGFVPCEPLPRDHQQPLPRDHQPLPRDSLQLDIKAASGLAIKQSRIPTSASSAPSRNIPELNWSISKEESPAKQYPRAPEEGLRGSASTSLLPDPGAGGRARLASESASTSRLPFLPLQEGSSGSSAGSTSTDSDGSTSERDRKPRRKNFEAFVMTGDRMINLAKTPANLDFQSKYPKPPAPQTAPPASCRALDSVFQATSAEEEKETATSLPSSPVGETSSQDNQRKIQQSPSDDTTSPDLSTSSLISCSEHYNGESLLDNIESPGSSPDTPEWSLIANGVGDSFHKDIPPNSSSKKSSRKEERREQEKKESLITNRDNRVIITINQNGGSVDQVTSPPDHQNGFSSPDTSSGTITPEQLEDEGGGRVGPPQPPSQSPPPLFCSPGPGVSSEEESDLDSLHSYHPPVKVVDIPSASRLAKRLYNLEGFRKSDISRHLSKNNEFSRAVAEEYCRLFKLAGLSVDQALRRFLAQLALTGETQDRERVLLHFSKRYLECNPGLRGSNSFQSHDAVHTLTCAIMLLNTDLHNEALQQRRMTTEEFVENLAELNDGTNFPEKLLRDIYSAIKEEPIEWVQDDSADSELQPTHPSNPANLENNLNSGGKVDPNPASSVSFTNQVGGINPFLSLPDPETAVDYKRGYVMRKSCFDPNYKKTKLGKRSWKMFYLTLRDLVLFCFKDEKTAQNTSSFESPQNAVRIHHSLAMGAEDYTKKQFVFRLKTCDRAEYLFQTSDQKELETWVETINTVVARYSSPPLPAPCSNSVKFQRPLYPSSRSKLSLADQLASHRTRVREVAAELGEHNADRPHKGAKGIVWSAWREKSEFLEGEVERYSAYINVLETIVSKQQTNQMVSSPLKVIAS